MKKSVFITVVLALTVLLSGCEMLTGILKGLGKKETDKNLITGTRYIPLEVTTKNAGKKVKVDLSDEGVKENSKVFVVQINNSGQALEGSDIISTLHSPAKMPLDSSSSSRSAYNADFESGDVIMNEIPDFVREWNKKPLPELIESEDVTSFARTVSDDEEELEVGSEKDFYSPMFKDAGEDDYTIVPAVLKYVSDHAYIYYYADIPGLFDYDTYENNGWDFLSDQDFENLGSKFDNIFEAETNLMGSNKITRSARNLIKADSDSKITILVHDIYCDSSEDLKDKSGTFGYFWGNDYYVGAENSNESQIIYIDSVLYKNSPDTTFSTLAHEFNHLLNFTNKEINQRTAVENTWFTEMLSMLSEDLLYERFLKTSENTVIKNRIPYFLGNYNYGFLDWKFNYEEDETVNVKDISFESYGNTFAYGSFILRNYGGVKLINEIATNKYVNEEAITNALETLNIKSPFDKKSIATFEDTVKDFCLSSLNYKVESATGLSTLNNSVSESLNGKRYSVSSILLSDFYPVRNSKYQKSQMGLWKFDEGGYDLGNKGMIIQYAGEGIESLQVTLPEYSGLDMYIVIQDFYNSEEKE